MRIYILSLLLACQAELSSVSQSLDHESDYWRAQSALLDPDAYFLIYDSGHTLDVTVPAGHTWYVANAFHVRYNEPNILGEDGYPGYYKSGFLRPLDSRRTIALPAGTRVRSNIQQNGAYLWYADPAAVWETDVRYQVDPRGLYYERLQRLTTLPIHESILEARPWGETGTQLELPLPQFESAILVGASVFDATWLNVGILNVMSEVNNVHTVRFAESLLAPFRRDRIGNPVVRLKAGNYAGHLNPDPNDPEGWDKCGTGNILYQVLPADW
jgi:hypothetical protein